MSLIVRLTEGMPGVKQRLIGSAGVNAQHVRHLRGRSSKDFDVPWRRVTF